MTSEAIRVWLSFQQALRFVMLLWVVFFGLWFLGIEPALFGIVPRTLFGLIGIFTSPLIHGDIFHLVSNSLPLLVLLTVNFLFYPNAGKPVLFWIYLMTGTWVWAAGRLSSHIGASGVLYGVASFLVFSGIFRRSLQARLVALIVALLYGGMVSGIFPGDPNISFESHFFGAVAGMVLAFIFRKHDRDQDPKYEWEDEGATDQDESSSEWYYNSELFPPKDEDD